MFETANIRERHGHRNAPPPALLPTIYRMRPVTEESPPGGTAVIVRYEHDMYESKYPEHWLVLVRMPYRVPQGIVSGITTESDEGLLRAMSHERKTSTYAVRRISPLQLHKDPVIETLFYAHDQRRTPDLTVAPPEWTSTWNLLAMSDNSQASQAAIDRARGRVESGAVPHPPSSSKKRDAPDSDLFEEPSAKWTRIGSFDKDPPASQRYYRDYEKFCAYRHRCNIELPAYLW